MILNTINDKRIDTRMYFGNQLKKTQNCNDIEDYMSTDSRNFTHLKEFMFGIWPWNIQVWRQYQAHGPKEQLLLGVAGKWECVFGMVL